tara:strand:- start:434 stop:625 length:192 start_codon:yes stop_codon:yes gene_type:complete
METTAATVVKNVESSLVEITSKDILYFIGLTILIIIIIGLFLIVPSPLDKKEERCESTLCHLF